MAIQLARARSSSGTALAFTCEGRYNPLMAQALTTVTRLRVVREIQEDDSGATIHFKNGAHGRLAKRDASYPTHLRLAQRSRERQHPVGVNFGEGSAIAELIRADNDVPLQLYNESSDCTACSSRDTTAFSGSRPTIRTIAVSAHC